MTMAVSDCETATDATGDESYVAADASSWVGDTASSNGTPPVASRMSFLPYIIAATASTMFLILYFWSKKVRVCSLEKFPCERIGDLLVGWKPTLLTLAWNLFLIPWCSLYFFSRNNTAQGSSTQKGRFIE